MVGGGEGVGILFKSCSFVHLSVAPRMIVYLLSTPPQFLNNLKFCTDITDILKIGVFLLEQTSISDKLTADSNFEILQGLQYVWQFYVISLTHNLYRRSI